MNNALKELRQNLEVGFICEALHSTKQQTLGESLDIYSSINCLLKFILHILSVSAGTIYSVH